MLAMVLSRTAWEKPVVGKHAGWYMRDAGGGVVSPDGDGWETVDLGYNYAEMRTWMK